MFNAPEINVVMERLKQDILENTEIKPLTRLLEKNFKNYNCEVQFLQDKKIPFDEYYIGGAYTHDNDKVHVVFHIGDDLDLLPVSEQEWSEFKFLFTQVLQHELIHRFQYTMRNEVGEGVCEVDHRFFENLSSAEEREYLADNDEIEAYSHDIIMEILFYYPSRNPRDVLRIIDRTRKIPTYNYYKKTFKRYNEREWNVIKKKLLKKSYAWLPYTTVFR